MKSNWVLSDWEVYKRDGCTCVYCGLNGLDCLDAWRQLALDHLIPVCRKGRDGPENKVVSCHRCNALKGSFDPSNGVAPLPMTNELRKQYIAAVRQHLDLYRCEDRGDFDLMMEEVKSSKK
jgi:5-methylcytosine-specific restriction endonuclease McrA